MQRVSTNLTLFYKLFFPIFWMVFFGCFVVAVLIINPRTVLGMSAPLWQIVIVGTYLLVLALIYWGIARLKRVEMDRDFVYVTNYFKTARYPWHAIEHIGERDWLIWHPVDITLREAGTFGRKITFVPSKTHFNIFLREQAELFERFKG